MLINNISIEEYVKKQIQWLSKTNSEYPADGFVIGVSGGIDSAVCLSLAKLTNLPVTALIMPSANNNDKDKTDALDLIKKLAIPYHIVEIDDVYDKFIDSTASFTNDKNNRQNVIKGNAQARIRMIYLYAYAQQNNRIVIGTDNACEWYLGYFTKFGDGACDIAPIINLKKSEVFELGKYLDIPKNILEKAPSAGLWSGQTDEDEIGVSYADIDSYIDGNDISEESKNRISFWHNRSHHKRRMPLSPEF